MIFLIADPSANTISTCELGGANRRFLATNGMTPNFILDGSGRIIFVALMMSGGPQIGIMNADGTNKRQLGNIPWSGITGGPIMPQMGRTGAVLFQEQGTDGSAIWVMWPDGWRWQVVRPAVKPTQPSLAASGTWFTYTSETTDPVTGAAHREIRRHDIDGTMDGNDRALTTTGDPDYPDANASNISLD